MFLKAFGRKVINEENAMEMIDFVLGSTGEESLCLEIKGLAVEILTDDTHT